MLWLLEDGDRIILNEGIGERLSKLGKAAGGNASPEQELAIAQKIFETVDRKAAEPQTRTETRRGVQRARQLFADELTLTPEERRILKSPYELLLIHDADGRLKSVTIGGAREVTIPPGIAADVVISHNHPSGRGPSDSDLKSALTNPGRTLRIVARNEAGKIEVFSLKFTGTLKKREIQGYAELYFELCQDGDDTHTGRRESLALISEVIGDSLQVVSRILQ